MRTAVQETALHTALSSTPCLCVFTAFPCCGSSVSYFHKGLFNRLVTLPVPCPEAMLQWPPVTVCSPCRLKVEELEAERSRLEEEKKTLEAQLERLTLQVSSLFSSYRVYSNLAVLVQVILTGLWFLM